MRRLLALLLCAVLPMTLSVQTWAAEVPEMPPDIYVLDMAEVLDERTEQAIAERGDGLFAVTGAQVAVVTVEKYTEGLAEQVLEEWYLGSEERNNGLVFVIDSSTRQVSYAHGIGLAEFFSRRSAEEYIKDTYRAELDRESSIDSATLALYNGIYSALQDYYEIYVQYWDGETYLYTKRFDTTVRDIVIICSLAAFLALVLWNEARRRRTLKIIEGQAEPEEEFSHETVPLENEDNSWKYN